MKFISGTLYKVKNKKESRTFMWMNVLGFQSNKLIYYLDNKHCLMFLEKYTIKYPIRYPATGVQETLNNYYNFLGGNQIFSFVISPENLTAFCSHIELL